MRPRPSTVTLLLSALCASGAAGCGAPPQLPPQVQVTFVNDTGAPICDVHIRRTETAAGGWQTDWLDRDEVVAAGMDRTFRLEPGSRWDVRLAACNGADLGTATGLPIDSDRRFEASRLGAR